MWMRRGAGAQPVRDPRRALSTSRAPTFGQSAIFVGRIRRRPVAIEDLDHREAVRGSGGAGLVAIARPEHFAHPFGALLSAADFDERSDDVAHHVLEERG